MYLNYFNALISTIYFILSYKIFFFYKFSFAPMPIYIYMCMCVCVVLIAHRQLVLLEDIFAYFLIPFRWIFTFTKSFETVKHQGKHS